LYHCEGIRKGSQNIETGILVDMPPSHKIRDEKWANIPQNGAPKWAPKFRNFEN